MNNRGNTGYHGRYTVSEFALVKGQLLMKYQEKYNAHHIDQVCRYIAKHDWPNIRSDAYTEAAASEGLGAAEAAVGMLLVYDEAQELFDRVHYGDTFEKRNYQALPDHVQKFLEKISC